MTKFIHNRRRALIGAVIVIPLTILVYFIGIAWDKNRQADASVKAYVDSVLPVILRTRSTKELLSRSAPNPQPPHPHYERMIASSIDKLKQFGPFVSYDGATVHLLPARTKDGVISKASCSAIVKFENGSARIGLGLVLTKGKWMISGFYVTDNAKFRLMERAMIRSDLLSPIFFLAILLPLIPGFVVACALACQWQDAVAWRSPEYLLVLVPTTAWNVLELPGVSWHPGKGWGNMFVELPALGMLAVVYVVVRRRFFPGVMPWWGYACASLISFVVAFASHKLFPTMALPGE